MVSTLEMTFLAFIQRDQGRLEWWVRMNLTKFNKANCKVLHFGLGNPKHKNRLGGEWDFWEQGLGGAGG